VDTDLLPRYPNFVSIPSISCPALSPVFLIVAFLIKKIASAGPILFVQERVGLNKRRFHLHKFRTMIDGAEQQQEELECLNEACGPVIKIKNDPRTTPVGRILRKLSIDEFPQLINVVKGDMSLVGPRPLPVRDYNGFSEDWHRRRFSVRPGITSVASERSKRCFFQELDEARYELYRLVVPLGGHPNPDENHTGSYKRFWRRLRNAHQMF
jgi:lipopolysaccharide/colanic/teichoic acid biosynthesis glycosyltransferase